MTKLLENIFRSVNIALVNELALLAERMEIDFWEVIKAADIVTKVKEPTDAEIAAMRPGQTLFAFLHLAPELELTEKILPMIDDAATKVTIEMMTAVLNALAVRTENEIAWMLEESAAIDAAATDLVARFPDAAALRAALDELQDGQPESMRLSDVAATYQRASEVLSRLTEAAYAASDATSIAAVERLIGARLATEQAAIGEFIAVGRD